MIILYLLFKDGLLEGDLQKLIFHSVLRRIDERVVRSLNLLGVRVTKPLKDPTPNRNRFRKPRPPTKAGEEPNDFSRYVTALKQMLEDHKTGTLDPQMFPYIKPELVPMDTGSSIDSGTQSLRSARPTWSSKSRSSVIEPRQRIIVFMAGGATFSEACACYEVSHGPGRDVFLGTSHMITPNSFLSQLQGLSESRDKLKMPADAPVKIVPRHLTDPDPVIPKPAPPPQPVHRPAAATSPASQAHAPPVMEMGGLTVHHKPNRPYYEEDKKKKKKKFGMF